ncbi:probable disease resistance protein [Tanacetum coccineum]
MAGSLLGGALVGTAISNLSEVIIQVSKKTLYFKSKLNDIQETLRFMVPIFKDIEKLDKELAQRKEEADMYIDLIKDAEVLVRKCERIKYNLWKRYRHASKLDKFNKSMLKFTQVYLPLVGVRDGKNVLVEVKGGSSGSSRVPLLHGNVTGFDDQVRALKAMVVKDPAGDDCSVVVVSAAGGCGKTTLVTMLCHDPEIKAETFDNNIYFVTVSSSPNIRVIIKSLLERNMPRERLKFANEAVAIQEWGSFLGENKTPVLLVLDDVWSHSIIEKFKFKSPGYKILVTSRSDYTQFNDKYKLHPLNRQYATDLFRHQAFSEERSDIPVELVNKLVESCQNHPLALKVIGGMLNGAPLASWETKSNELSTGNRSMIWNSNEFIELILEKSLDLFDEPELKQCYLDLGLFPEDQRIAATTLMDMWVHLYNHDKEGSATLDKLFRLSTKNLATLLPISLNPMLFIKKIYYFISSPLQMLMDFQTVLDIHLVNNFETDRRKHLAAVANHCQEEVVMQHDMMRTLAIRLISQGLVQHRERLILSPRGESFPIFRKTIHARLLSISTDERFPLRWNRIKVPEVEVFVLNFMSKMHPLPKFMKKMKRLKVLIITNYGSGISQLENFPAPKRLAGLTSIRLDHVSVSSISTSILELVNLQKLSLIMCKIGNSFNEATPMNPNHFTSLSEIDIDSCDDLTTFPAMLCNILCLKKLSVTNCHELTSLTEGFRNLVNLEVLRLASCSKLTEIPESLGNLQKLRTVDLSHCLSLCKLPENIGASGSLKTIDMSGCMGLIHDQLPISLHDLLSLKVICDDEISLLWSEFTNVDVTVVQEDRLHCLSWITSREYE